MNFYSLDGSKKDSNNLFENSQIFETFENTQDSTLDNVIGDENEEFASIPTTKSASTDSNFQCSDGYKIEGSNLGKQYTNSNISDCKMMCSNSGSDCIGFNFDSNNNICTLKKNASSMLNTYDSSTLCVKKSAGKTGCKSNEPQSNSDTIRGFNELDSIFNENNSTNQQNPPNRQNLQNLQNRDNRQNLQNLPNRQNLQNLQNRDNRQNPQNRQNPIANLLDQQNRQNLQNTMDDMSLKYDEPSSQSSPKPSNIESKYPMEIPTIETSKKLLTNSEIELESELESESISKTNNNMLNNQSGVYVDLNCFMKNINVLQNHTDNMMIDMSLLLSNIRTCSYIKKSSSETDSSNKKMDSKELLEKINSKINIPQPDTVSLKNIKADVVVSSGVNSPSQVLKVSKEPSVPDSKMLEYFDSVSGSKTETEKETNNWKYIDLVTIVIILVILCLLIFFK
jgi:hypothetical protein